MKRKIILWTALLVFLLACAGCQKKADVKADAAVTEEMTESEESTAFSEVQADAEELILVEGNRGVIRIGTTGAPYTEMLTYAKRLLAKEGWDLQIEVYSDYTKVNQEVLDGTLDAHLFAHQTYIDSYNDVNHSQLTSVAPICYEKWGIYSLLNEDLTKMQSEISIGIPSEVTMRAKSLLFLNEMGYLTLKENVGLTAIMEDILENPYNLKFVEYTKDNVKEVLKQTDYCVMGANQAILAGLEPHKEALKTETSQMNSSQAMAAQLVTTSENTGNEKILILIDVFQSEEMQKYVDDTYKDALELFY